MTSAYLSEKCENHIGYTAGKGFKVGNWFPFQECQIHSGTDRLADYFDAISDGTNISKSKPDPEVFLKAAKFMGLKPEECLVVEDATAGVDAARAGGMKAAAVGDAAKKSYGDYILSSFSDLLKILT